MKRQNKFARVEGLVKCPDCFGTGTIFKGKKLGTSCKCPRCHGKCKIQSPVHVDDAHRAG